MNVHPSTSKEIRNYFSDPEADLSPSASNFASFDVLGLEFSRSPLGQARAQLPKNHALLQHTRVLRGVFQKSAKVYGNC